MSDQEPDKEFMRKLLFKQRILLVVFILLAAGLLAYADWHWKHNFQNVVIQLNQLSDKDKKENNSLDISGPSENAASDEKQK